MIKTEISEIKKQFHKDADVITKLCACYVDAEKHIKLMTKNSYFNIAEEEAFKYEEIFRKTLSGVLGKNLINIDIPIESEMEGGAQEFLMRLRASNLEDDELNKEFFNKVIENFVYPENYYIILIDIKYDVPGKAKDGSYMHDASDNVYHALLCSICPVALSKAGLSYYAEKDSIEERVRDWVVGDTMKGFLFPSFRDRTSDIHEVLYFSKKADDLGVDFVESIFGAACPIPALVQKEIIQGEMAKALGEDCNYETVARVHECIQDIIDENADNPEPVILGKQDMLKVLSISGADEEAIQAYEASEANDIEVMADNIVNKRNFLVKTAGISIKSDSEHMSYIKTMMIEGRKCIVIDIESDIEINGINVK